MSLRSDYRAGVESDPAKNKKPATRPASFVCLIGGLRRLGDGDALALQQFLQFAGLEHLAHDIAAADELALHIELRDSRPAREILDALAQAGIGQHVDTLELDAHVAQHLDHRRGEAALREDW